MNFIQTFHETTMKLLISQVGFQPGAVACTVRTLQKSGLVDHVWLLATKATQKTAYRLQQVLEEWDLWVRIQSINYGSGAAETAVEAVHSILDNRKTGQPLPFLDVTPGLHYQTGALSRSLRELDDFRMVYADHQALHQLGTTPQKWQLQDIGTDKLFSLHGLRPTIGQRQENICYEVEFSTATGRVFFNAVAEIQGRLRAILDIDRKNKPLQEARLLKSLLRDSSILNHLHPHVYVLTKDQYARKRLKAYSGFYLPRVKQPPLAQAVAEKLDRAAIWPSPGYHRPGKADTPLTGMQMCKGRGGSGAPLILCLGNDPSSTLTVLFSQQPVHVIICYDQKSLYIQCLAERIRQQAHLLPAGEILFLPTDFLGTGLITEILTIIETLKSSLHNWEVNISPGTKAQSWELGRLPDVALFSLKQSDSVSLSGNKIYPAKQVPLLIQAACCGGRLKPNIEQRTSVLLQRGQHGFLDMMLSFSADKVKERSSLATLQWDVGTEHKSKWKKFPGGKKQYSIRCTGKADQGLLQFTIIRYRQKTGSSTIETREEHGVLPGPIKTGCWVEPLVAWAFLRHHRKLIDEVIIGLEWDWLDILPTPEEIHRTEIDIVLHWRNKIVAISCKTAVSRQDLSNKKEEIIAVARTGLGRFCLPVLVYPMKKDCNKNSLRSERRSRLLEIPLSCLNDPGFLKSALDSFAEHQRTTA